MTLTPLLPVKLVHAASQLIFMVRTTGVVHVWPGSTAGTVVYMDCLALLYCNRWFACAVLISISAILTMAITPAGFGGFPWNTDAHLAFQIDQHAIKVMFHRVSIDARLRPRSALLFNIQSVTCVHPSLASLRPGKSFQTLFTHPHSHIRCSSVSWWSHRGHVGGTCIPRLASSFLTASTFEASFHAKILIFGSVFNFQIYSHNFQIAILEQPMSIIFMTTRFSKHMEHPHEIKECLSQIFI